MTPSATQDRSPRVAVVILTWNALAYTKRCLEALRERTRHPDWRVIVVDNGSTDGTVEWLRRLDWVTLITNGTNLGFSRACNIGMRACAPDEDVVLMNNDVVVIEPQWLARLQEVAYSGTKVGVVGTRLIDGQGRVNHLGSYMPPIAGRGHQIGGQEIDIEQGTRVRPVECVVFAQAYLRRDCIDKIGVLDETLFAYFEDTDYCFRATRAGFEVLYAGNVCSVHFNNTSTRENRVDFWSIYERSRKIFLHKWSGWLDRSRYDAEVQWNSVVNRPLGLASQSRNLMRALHFNGVRVTYRNAYARRDRPTDDQLIDDLLKRPARARVPQIAFCPPGGFRRTPGPFRIGWSMCKFTGVPEHWVDACNGMDEVWVPTQFNVETYRQSGVKVPVRCMPLGVNIDYFHPRITGFRPSERFTFLSLLNWDEQDAPEAVLRAFAHEFKRSEDALLVLSVVTRDWTVNVHRDIAKLDLPPTAPVIVMVNQGFAEYQMGALYRSADCFVLPTRGTGWGMPILEAMACGLPTIATDWSGPSEYLHGGNGYPLEVESLVPARVPSQQRFRWAEPNVDHLRFLMREIFDNPDPARERGLAAAAEVGGKYTWDHAAARVKSRILELS